MEEDNTVKWTQIEKENVQTELRWKKPSIQLHWEEQITKGKDINVLNSIFQNWNQHVLGFSVSEVCLGNYTNVSNLINDVVIDVKIESK